MSSVHTGEMEDAALDIASAANDCYAARRIEMGFPKQRGEGFIDGGGEG